jgi:signal transduction histidine kinase
MSKLRILIVDDDEDDYVIMSHHLSRIKTQHYDVFWCNDFDLAEGEIMKNEHDIYLIDHFLGKGEGIEIIESVRKRGYLKPLILLTGAGSIQVDEKAMEKGASDFIVKKEVRVDTLERSLRYAMERYHQEQYIRTQEKKYRSLFELSMEPVLILNEHFTIQEYNAAFINAFHDKDSNEHHLLQAPFKELFKYDFDFDELISKLKSDGFVQNFQTTMFDGKKDVVVILSFASLPQAEEKEGKLYHVAIHDVTALLEKEQELKKVEKLTLTGRMARMIAHEVRNPLTNINLALGEIENITEGMKDVDVFQSMISRNTKRISTLIDDLLKSARPAELSKVNTSLQQILNASLSICQDRIDLVNVRLEKEIPSTPFIGQWDAEKLKIAFVNIITNAIEAMSEVSNPSLSIRMNIKDGNPIVYIKDNGKGMNEEEKKNLFDPFFTSRKNGLGLGMTATLNIINMHNGSIRVDSVENRGTEFKISL